MRCRHSFSKATRNALAYLFKNRMYLGELNHGANSYPGEHLPVVARKVYRQVHVV